MTTLTDGLIAYWPMSEVSGSRADSVGSHTLAQTGTVGSDTGKLTALAAEWETEDAGNYLSVISDDFDRGNTSFTIAAWIYQYSVPGGSPLYRGIVGTGVNTWSGGWMLFASGYGVASHIYHSGSSSLCHAVCDPYLNGWHLVVMRFDADDDTHNLYLDDVLGESQPETVGPQDQGSTTLWVGNVGGTSYPWHGRIGPAMIWNRALTTDEMTELYNAGAGIAYPFAPPPRVALTTTTAPGSTAHVGAALAMEAANPTAGNEFVTSGNDLIIIHNTGEAIATIEVTSTNDEYHRTKDVSESIDAGVYKIIGPLKRPGWEQTDGKIYLTANSANVKVSVVAL